MKETCRNENPRDEHNRRKIWASKGQVKRRDSMHAVYLKEYRPDAGISMLEWVETVLTRGRMWTDVSTTQKTPTPIDPPPPKSRCLWLLVERMSVYVCVCVYVYACACVCVLWGGEVEDTWVGGGMGWGMGGRGDRA
jgi:hypothetical protein